MQFFLNFLQVTLFSFCTEHFLGFLRKDALGVGQDADHILGIIVEIYIVFCPIFA